MKRTLFLFVFLLSVGTISTGQAPVEVFFSPKGGCTAAIVKEIANAKKQILVQAYGFSSTPIASALVDAKNRGVSVLIILDKSNVKLKYQSLFLVKKAGIVLKIDSSHSIAHNKIMIIDDFVVITGSFNFTENAELKNAENVVIIRDEETASIFSKNWSEHSLHSMQLR